MPTQDEHVISLAIHRLVRAAHLHTHCEFDEDDVRCEAIATHRLETSRPNPDSENEPFTTDEELCATHANTHAQTTVDEVI